MPKKIYFITGNKYKVDEISRILGRNVKLIPEDLNIPENEFESVEHVAIDKAKKAFEITKKPLIAEDTGVFFNAYNNFPGLYAKRMYLSLGFNGLTQLLKGTKNKKGFFQSTICFIWKKNCYKTFTGKLGGKFLTKPQALNVDRLPYEKIFIPKGKKTVLAKISVEEKNTFSHRAKAAKQLKKFLKQSES